MHRDYARPFPTIVCVNLHTHTHSETCESCLQLDRSAKHANVDAIASIHERIGYRVNTLFDCVCKNAEAVSVFTFHTLATSPHTVPTVDANEADYVWPPYRLHLCTRRRHHQHYAHSRCETRTAGRSQSAIVVERRRVQAARRTAWLERKG